MAKDLEDRLNEGTLDLAAIEPPPGKEPPAPAFKRFGDVSSRALDRFERRARGDEKPIPLPFERLARVFGGGLWPGFHVFVAGTGKGKTQFALQLALHAAENGTPALYVGLELGELDWVARLIGARSRRAWSSLFLGTFANDPQRITHEMTGFRTAAEDLAKLPLYLIEGPPQGWAYSNLRTAAEELRAVHPKSEGPALLVLDFLQIVGKSEDREELRERIGRAAYQCRAVARDLDFAVLALSSTSRENYSALETGDGLNVEGEATSRRGVVLNPDRLIGLGKESGEVEYAADSVMVAQKLPFLSQEEWTSGLALVVSKVRAGRPGWVAFDFNGHRFEEHDWPDMEALRATLSKPKTERKAGKAKTSAKTNGTAGDATPPAPWKA